MSLCKFEILGVDRLNYRYVSKLHQDVFDDKDTDTLVFADSLLFPRAAKVSPMGRLMVLGDFMLKLALNRLFKVEVSLSYPIATSTMKLWIILAQKDAVLFEQTSDEGMDYKERYYPDLGYYNSEPYCRRHRLNYDQDGLPTLKGISHGDIVYREYIYCLAR